MLLTTIIIVAIVLFGCVMMSSVQISNINRAAVAMFCGVSAWVVYMLHGSDFLSLMGYPDYNLIGQEKDFIAQHVIVKYINEACQVILFLIATNTIVEIMSNNGVFDSLLRWLRTRNSRIFLWSLSLLTFAISANVDNLTTVVLMMSIMGQVVSSHRQRVVYACVILISAILGGSFTVIGDMTSLMLWVHGVVTPSAYAGGLILPVLTSLVVFNLLISRMLVGNVEVSSILGRYDGYDSWLRPWQKALLLVIGIVGLWSIPTFHTVTKLPPFLGALCVLALIWLVESLYNFKRSGNMLFIQHKYIRNTEFIGMRLILYFLGVSLAVGAVVECGALSFVGEQLTTHIHNVYAYGAIIGAISSVIDNIPFVMVGLNLFEQDAMNAGTDFVQNGTYWQLLSYCSAMGGSLLFVGTMSGHAVAEVERISLAWYIRHILPRVLLAWAAGMVVFYLTHL